MALRNRELHARNDDDERRCRLQSTESSVREDVKKYRVIVAVLQGVYNSGNLLKFKTTPVLEISWI